MKRSIFLEWFPRIAGAIAIALTSMTFVSCQQLFATLFGITVSGKVTIPATISIPNSSPVHVQVMKSSSQPASFTGNDVAIALTGTGRNLAFSFSRVPIGMYLLRAFMDQNVNGIYDSGESVGYYPLSGQLMDFQDDVPDIAIDLVDYFNGATNPQPANGSSDIPLDIGKIGWTAAADSRNRAITYDVFFGSGQLPTTAVATGLTRTEWYVMAAPLTPASIYKWKIVSWAGNDSVESDVWTFTTLGSVGAPIFSLPEGQYSNDQLVRITCATAGATIYYTTDGNTPTTSSSMYSDAQPIAVSGNGMRTIKAMAARSGMPNSPVISADFIISYPRLASPTFNPTEGRYTTEQHISIESPEPGATVRFTVDGSDPTTDHGQVFDSPIRISAPTTVRAIASMTGRTDSSIGSATYQIAYPTGDVTGRIIDSAGVGIEGVALTMASSTAVTSSNGDFIFVGLEPGFPILHGEGGKQAHFIVSRTDVTVVSGTTVSVAPITAYRIMGCGVVIQGAADQGSPADSRGLPWQSVSASSKRVDPVRGKRVSTPKARTGDLPANHRATEEFLADNASFFLLDWEALNDSRIARYSVVYQGLDMAANSHIWRSDQQHPEDPLYDSSNPQAYLDLSSELQGLVDSAGRYYFQIIAEEDSGAQVLAFPSIGIDLGMALGAYPTAITYTSGSLSWAMVEGANGYRVQVFDAQDMKQYDSSPTPASLLANATATLPTSLQGSTYYNCHIDAYFSDEMGWAREITRGFSGFIYP